MDEQESRNGASLSDAALKGKGCREVTVDLDHRSVGSVDKFDGRLCLGRE